MPDRYRQLVTTPMGQKVADLLGLPKPVQLRRHQPGQPLVTGPVLVTGDGRLRPRVEKLLAAHGVTVHGAIDEQTARYAAIVHDATGITSSPQLRGVYEALHTSIRRLGASARVIVLGTASTLVEDVAERTAQRALEGFVRSVAKELRAGGTAQLVEVAPDAEEGIDAPLRFLLSGRSAFVSGQVVRVGPATEHEPVTPADLDHPLAGKLAVVTGAAQGIGASIAEVLSRDGAHVICLDLPAQGQALAQVANRVGGESVQLDITAEDAPARLGEQVARHGGLDIMVHNAGVTRDKTLAGMDDKRWDMVLAINLTAQERIDRHLLDEGLLNDNGRIVCVSSMSGIAGNRGQTNYAASKAGVIGHVEAVADRLASLGATANAVAPGFIETEMTDRMPLGPREVGRRISSLGQGGRPVDVAETIGFFAWPDATWINGTTLRVCGQNLLGA